MKNAKFKIQNWFLAFCILIFAFLISACGVPNLESKGCNEAREVVKRFYSFHFGNDMTPSPEYVRLRERFLTPEYYSELGRRISAGIDIEIDEFTPFSEKGPPRTFKVGKCQEFGDRPVFQLQFYWRDDHSTEQEEFFAEMERVEGIWLIRYVGTAKIP